MRKFVPSLITVVMMMMISLVPSKRGLAQDSLSIGAKGMYLWQLWNANGGGQNLNTIINKLNSIGVTWLVIKMADGDSYYNSPNHSLYNWAIANYGSMDNVVATFHANGIKLLAFHYVYGVPHHWGNLASETDVANAILDVQGLDGLIIDAEIQYDTLANRVAAARSYCDSIHAHHPGAFLGLTAWARINGHNTFPWTTFLSRVDVNMPQTYWAARPTTVQNELSVMSSQFIYYTNIWISQGDSAADKPIMPLGQGEYFGYSHDVLPGEITSFCDLSQITYNYPGVSLWEYNQISHQYVWEEYAAAWQPTSISDKSNNPVQYHLAQNYPNPFNPTTTISFDLQKKSFVTLKVFDLLGNEVATLAAEELAAGTYSKQWDAAGFASGVYFYQLTAGSFVKTKKLILLQ
jgi:hypothetical protein